MAKQWILAVDDDPDILLVLKSNLELYGYEPILANSRAKAGEALNEKLPDLVILDVTLPDGNGVEICRDLKQRYPKVPVIMLTARDRVSDKVTGLECGADDYVVKPFETLELMARIKACLRRYSPALETITVGDLVIDLKTRTVRLGGRELELTPKEYDLLRLLAANRGEPLSRDYIRKSLWKSTRIYSWSRVIDVHIQHLRQKIEKNPLEPEYIVTVPGIGYRMK